MFKLVDKASIGVKVSLAPAFAILCMALVAALAMFTFNRLSTSVQKVGVEATQKIVRAQQMSLDFTHIFSTVLQSLVWEATGAKAETIERTDKNLAEAQAAFRKSLAEVLADTTLTAEQRTAWQDFAKNYETFEKTVKQTLGMKSAGLNMAAMFIVSMNKSSETTREAMARIVAAEVEASTTAAQGATQDTRRGSVLLAAALGTAVLLSGLMAWWCARVIVRPLTHAADIAARVATGDLSARPQLQTGDATGRVLDAMGALTQNLSHMVADIRDAAGQIDVASSEIAAGNTDLSQRTELAASSLQQTASSVEQLTAALKNSADSALQASTMAREATAAAGHGGQAVSEVVQTMDQINTHAKKIREIIGTIDGIAFQTNILALNAAVEAARAGEQGRGFSVVASEVRTLAQRSAGAAREIRDLIGTSVAQMEAGSQKAQAAGEMVQRIVQSVQRVDTTINEISRMSAEQAAGIEQINRSVSDMDRATQQNSALVEQAAAAAESMRQQSARLVQTISSLRTA